MKHPSSAAPSRSAPSDREASPEAKRSGEASGLLPCLLAFLFATCASSVANTTTSGIFGQVFIGPVCPVVQVNNPCPDKPYQATIIVLDSNRNQVTRFQTDAQGNFKIGLKPGTYILAPQSPNVMPSASEQTVTVTSGLFTQVTITYDSGIR